MILDAILEFGFEELEIVVQLLVWVLKGTKARPT
jgi:hypothetical protein